MNGRDDIVQTPIGVMWLENGVLIHRVETLTVNQADAASIPKAVAVLTGGRPVPAVVDIRNVAFAEHDARAAFAGSPDESLEIATALVVAHGASTTMGRIFMKLDRPARPVEMFTSMDEAIAWAKSHLEPDA